MVLENQVILEVNNLSKTFVVKQNKMNTIRDRTIGLFRSNPKQVIRAVEDINFKIVKGEKFGIIGRNGSGKSTLLKLIMGTIRPNKGSEIKIEGKLMRLALGMGMDKNLTARDNIYLNASILGLSFKQISSIFEKVLKYADLEEFVDTPLKHFSQGMLARLKFSIAIHANADIFLLDEFFGGVGDENFKKKSDEAFKSTFLVGRTVLLVSHNLGIINQYCDRVLWIDNGKQAMLGKPQEVVKAYRQSYLNKKRPND